METSEKRKKYGGRKKGTPNKKTLILQESLEDLGLDPVLGLKACLEELQELVVYEPEAKINLIKAKSNIYMELLQYLYPKRKAIEFEAKDETHLTVVTLNWEDDDPTHASPDAASKTDQPIAEPV